MNFEDCPKHFINEYYREKINQIDLNCERAVLETKDEEEIKCLNNIRSDMIDKIKSVREDVYKRCDKLEMEYSSEFFLSKINEIKKQTFWDQYCFVFGVYKWFPLFEFKCGVVIFSQYEDDLFKVFRYLKTHLI